VAGTAGLEGIAKTRLLGLIGHAADLIGVDALGHATDVLVVLRGHFGKVTGGIEVSLIDASPDAGAVDAVRTYRLKDASVCTPRESVSPRGFVSRGVEVRFVHDDRQPAAVVDDDATVVVALAWRRSFCERRECALLHAASSGNNQDERADAARHEPS
jgi:hypothetical protein